MAEIVGFEVHPLAGARVRGRSVAWQMGASTPNPVPALWQRLVADGAMDALEALPGVMADYPGCLGLMDRFDPATGELTYLAGVLAEPGSAVPEGYEFRDLGPCEVAHALIRGSHETGEVYMNASQLCSTARDAAGFAYDDRIAWEAESYHPERSLAPMQRGEATVVLDYLSPARALAPVAREG